VWLHAPACVPQQRFSGRHCAAASRTTSISLLQPSLLSGMVLSIIIASLVAPGLLGSQEAIRQGQAKDKREEHRARRCNLIANCVTSSARSREIDGRPVVLRNGKLWIDSGTKDESPLGHRYAGYYLPYPDTKYEGLVTTITNAAPVMNWVYVDSNSHEVRYGVRADAQPNRTGPFDCTRQDRRLTFEGWEGWCAVEELPGIWALYFDVDDDGLKSKVAPGTRVLELELSRKEKKFKKETDARQRDQTTTREVDTKQDAPVDRPIVVDPQVQRPGVFGFADNGTKPSERVDGSGPEHDVPQEPPMPKTPPPAYSKNEGPEPQEFSLAPAGPYQAYVTEELQEIYVAPTAPQESSATSARQDGLLPPLFTRQEQEDVAPIPSTQANNDSLSMRPPLRPTQSSQSLAASSSSRPSLQFTPSPQSNTSPLSWRPPLQSTPSGDKPPPPKLNRNSGNRAMSQAQMFDALDAAKKASEDMLAMVRGRTTASRASNRGSRANSEAGSISVYSDDGRRQSRDERPQSSALQMRPGSSLPRPEEVPQEEPSQAEPPLEQTPREETPSPVDPAIFGVSDRSEKRRESVTPLRRSKTASTPTTQRGPAVSPTKELATPRRPGSRGVIVTRSPAFSSSPRTPTRASLASTMSSGAAGKQPVMNRTQSTITWLSRMSSARPAEPSRVGPGAGNNAGLRNQGLVRSRTSTLLRSLDNLVGQEKQEESVPAPLNITRPPSAPSGAGRGGTARRGLPVRGRGNSRVGGGGDAGKKQVSRDK
jgi:hypothetical protein